MENSELDNDAKLEADRLAQIEADTLAKEEAQARIDAATNAKEAEELRLQTLKEEAELAHKQELVLIAENNAKIEAELEEAKIKHEIANQTAILDASQVAELNALMSELVPCGVFDADGKLIRKCEVPESMVSLQANAELGEVVKRGEFKYEHEDVAPDPSWSRQRADAYPSQAVFQDAYYHLMVNNDDTKMKEWAAACKQVKDSIPKPESA